MHLMTDNLAGVAICFLNIIFNELLKYFKISFFLSSSHLLKNITLHRYLNVLQPGAVLLLPSTSRTVQQL